MSVGTRLAAVDTTTVCDGPGQHDVRIITDGQVAYAYGLGMFGQDCPLTDRVGTLVRALCEQTHNSRLCRGLVTVDLTDAGAWTSAVEPLALLEQYGEQVDR